MPRATCRCGQSLPIPRDGSDRIVCPKCGARVRLRRSGGASGDGFVRFACPCGRRLKVPVGASGQVGKCPECGRVVQVPEGEIAQGPPPGHPEAGTIDLSADEMAALDRWSRERGAAVVADPLNEKTPVQVQTGPSATERAEAGMRICPRCRKPIHLGADVCRSCGTAVPRK